MRIEVTNIDGLPAAARQVLEALGDCRVVALEGPMGAGKTTLVSAICKELGMEEEASSPTFSIVNEYVGGSSGRRVCHFDFYRIRQPEEALDLGLDDYFDSGDLCLMEWSGQVAGFLPDDLAVVSIEALEDGTRIIEVQTS